MSLARKAGIPSRRDPKYAETMRALHSAILGLCALIESFPYSVEPWMPPMTDGTSSSFNTSRLSYRTNMSGAHSPCRSCDRSAAHLHNDS